MNKQELINELEKMDLHIRSQRTKPIVQQPIMINKPVIVIDIACVNSQPVIKQVYVDIDSKPDCELTGPQKVERFLTIYNNLEAHKR